MGTIAAIGIGLQALGTYGNWKAEREQAIATGKQMSEQATNAIRSMNYAFQNFEQERQDSFEAAMANLEKLDVNTRGLQGAVNAAVSEDMGDSNTGRLLSRATHAEALRTALMEKTNFKRKSNEIDLNKEQQLLYTKSYTAGLHPPSMPSKGALFSRLLQTGFSAYNQAKDIEHYRKTHYYTDNALSTTSYTHSNYTRPYFYSGSYAGDPTKYNALTNQLDYSWDDTFSGFGGANSYTAVNPANSLLLNSMLIK